MPKMFVFDQAGVTKAVRYGAPPDLHREMEQLLASLTTSRTGAPQR